MSDPEPISIEKLRRRLSSVMATVLKQAESNPQFAADLAHALGLSGGSPTASPADGTKPKALPLNAVAILQAAGHAVLRTELERLTDDELRLIARAETGLKGEKLKKTTRADLIAAIAQGAERMLGKGSSFLGSAPSVGEHD